MEKTSIYKEQAMQTPESTIRTIPALLDFCETRHGPIDVFRWREGEEIHAVTYARFAREARALAGAIETATPAGAHIAILGENSYAWLLCWFAALGAGRAAVPLDPQLPAADLLALLRKSDAALLFCSSSFSDVAAQFGNAVFMKEVPALLAPYENSAVWPREARPDDLAAIVYTSGTTGEPKGVLLSHWNFMSDALSGCRVMPIAGHTLLAVLPFYHTLSITPGMLAQLPGGSTVCICGGLRHLTRDLAAFRPAYMVVVPLLAEGMYQQVWAAAKKEGKDKLLRAMLKISGGLQRLGIDLRRRLFKSVLAAFGGNLEWILCGGAPISEECVEGFLRFGIEILPAYGVSECAPGVSLNQRGACRAQSVGQVLDCCQVKIEEGEIFVRGDNVSSGYYKDEQATREAFADGWHRTGDLGYMDGDGYLFITGRKKNLIVLSNGKNVSPEGLEYKLMQISFVKEALVTQEGDDIVAELFLDEEQPDAAARLEEELLALNRRLPVYQRIVKTVLRETEFPKTTTKKIKRG